MFEKFLLFRKFVHKILLQVQRTEPAKLVNIKIVQTENKLWQFFSPLGLFAYRFLIVNVF